MVENMPLGGKRQSNIEALRLLSMLMVLNLHSFWGYDYNHGSELFQVVDFFRESTSICAVNVFILISGYFGIKWKAKSFFNLIFQVLFYSFAVYLVAVLIGAIDFNKSEFLNCFKGLYKSWGFITSYVTLYFLSPWLNAFAENTPSRTILLYILILFIAENFIFLSTGVINFCLLYIIGRLIHKTEMPNKLRVNANYSYWIVTFLIFVSVFALYLKFHWDAETMCRIVIAYSYSSPLIILQAVFLFLIFSRIKIQSNFINWCASSCLAIFLIHMHPAIKYIGYYNYTESLYELQVSEHILMLFFTISSVFFGSILIDKVRKLISDSIYCCLIKIYRKIPNKIKSFDTYLPNQLREII